MWITLIILVVAIILFLTEKLPADLVAILVALSLGFSGVLSFGETFAGFSSNAVITIMAIFILAEGLRQAGITELIGGLLIKLGGRSESTLVLLVMAFSAALSLFMNNIAVAAVLLPATVGATHKIKVSPSRILMPLAFATILGGMATLFTSTNIIASSLLVQNGIKGYGVLDFAPLGIPVTIGGILFIYFFGRKVLPNISTKSMPEVNGDLVDTYRLEERLTRVKLASGCKIAGSTVASSGLREKYGLNLVAVERQGEMILTPPPDFRIRQTDVLLLEGRVQEIDWNSLSEYFEVLPTTKLEEVDFEDPKIALTEVVLSPRSAIIGKSLKEIHFREKYGMLVLGIWRAGRPIRSGLANQKLQFGDALLIQGPRERLKVLAVDPDLILLEAKEGVRQVSTQKSIWAGVIFAAVIILSILFSDYIPPIMLGGGLLMILFGLIRMEAVYRSIEWKSVFIVAGMLPMGSAITQSGLGSLIAEWLLNLGGASAPYLLLVILFFLTVLLSQVVHGAVIAAIMVPISIQVSNALGVEPRSVVMAVTLATSMTLITPLGHPVNVLVMGPGGYKFKDYVRLGLPLTLVVSVIILTLIPIIWPL